MSFGDTGRRSAGNIIVATLLLLALETPGFIGVLEAVSVGSSSLSLRISPQIAFEPAKVTVIVTLEPHYQNSALCLSWWETREEAFVSADCRSIDGQYERRTTQLEYVLGAGEYQFQAAVQRGPQWLKSNIVPVHVESSR